MVRSWKTTVLGVIAVLTVVFNVAQLLLTEGLAGLSKVNWDTTLAALSAGFGLILAKDATVTGPAPAPTEAEKTA